MFMQGSLLSYSQMNLSLLLILPYSTLILDSEIERQAAQGASAIDLAYIPPSNLTFGETAVPSEWVSVPTSEALAEAITGETYHAHPGTEQIDADAEVSLLFCPLFTVIESVLTQL
jgi:hypothetical protein